MFKNLRGVLTRTVYMHVQEHGDCHDGHIQNLKHLALLVGEYGVSRHSRHAYLYRSTRLTSTTNRDRLRYISEMLPRFQLD